MIELELTKAEALLAFELIKENADNLLEQIINAVDEEATAETMKLEARKNYRINIENEAQKVPALEARIKELVALIDSHTLAAKSNTIKTRKTRALKPDAPWGYKKDGTPKKKPGGKVGF